MASLITIPFNYFSTSTTSGFNASYTVGAGKYSIVTFNSSQLQQNAMVTYSWYDMGSSPMYGKSRPNNFKTYLKAGDTLTASISNFGGGANTSPAVKATLTVSVNGTIVYRSTIAFFKTLDGANTDTALAPSSGDYGFVAQEFIQYS